MFHPFDHTMERGWVGRIDAEHVVQLAAQTLQSFFTGGGSAREHAVYPLAEACLLAPVLHPPAVRIFDDQVAFEFANPAAIVGPRAAVGDHRSIDASSGLLQNPLILLPRLAAVVGAEGELGGFTILSEWRDPGETPPKDRDFALGLGPLLVTQDEVDPDGLEAVVRVDGSERLRGRLPGFDWAAARDRAAAGTALRPGDLLAGPSPGWVDGIAGGTAVEVEVEGIGVLVQTVSA
jgi:hypothetical protein